LPPSRAKGVFALALRAPSNTPLAHKCKHSQITFAARITLLLVAVHKYRTEGQTVNAAGKKSDVGSAWALGAEYSLSKRTGLFAHYGDLDNAVQSAYRVGIRHKF
jgi:predicted porin